MRDDQVLALIKRESAYQENISMLQARQDRMQLESVIEAISERGSIIKMFFNRDYLQKRVEEIYTKKAKDFNEKIKSAMAREKLKI